MATPSVKRIVRIQYSFCDIKLDVTPFSIFILTREMLFSEQEKLKMITLFITTIYSNACTYAWQWIRFPRLKGKEKWRRQKERKPRGKMKKKRSCFSWPAETTTAAAIFRGSIMREKCPRFVFAQSPRKSADFPLSLAAFVDWAVDL